MSRHRNLFYAKDYVRPNCTEAMAEDIKAAFDYVDADSDGYITKEELKKALDEAGMDSNTATIEAIVRGVDRNRDDRIEFPEFFDLMIGKVYGIEKKEDLEALFYELSKGQEFITVEDLAKIAKDLDDNITDEELNKMINKADKDGDGKVGLEDFTQIFTPPTETKKEAFRKRRAAKKEEPIIEKTETLEKEAEKKPRKTNRRKK